PALQEQIDHGRDKSDRDQQRLDDLFHALADGFSRIDCNRKIDVSRKAALRLGHEFSYTFRSLNRVRTGQLVNGDHGARFTVQVAGDAVVLRSQLNPGDIANTYDAGFRSFANDDLFEFFGRSQAPLCAYGIGEWLAGRRRLAADLSGGIHGVLGL